MTQELLEKGYFQDGALGMTHTESQLNFFKVAAMIPCGTWLEAEMIEHSRRIPNANDANSSC